MLVVEKSFIGRLDLSRFCGTLLGLPQDFFIAPSQCQGDVKPISQAITDEWASGWMGMRTSAIGRGDERVECHQ